jgi:hypothetical protein
MYECMVCRRTSWSHHPQPFECVACIVALRFAVQWPSTQRGRCWWCGRVPEFWLCRCGTVAHGQEIVTSLHGENRGTGHDEGSEGPEGHEGQGDPEGRDMVDNGMDDEERC